MANPLFRERDIDFLLYDVLRAQELPAYDRESCDMVIDAARRFARNTLWPTYRALDVQPPRFEGGRVFVHPRLKEVFGEMSALGLVEAARELPRVVHTFATAYLMAANGAAYGYLGLATGAAHLLETFASDELKSAYMAPIYDGKWLGTMALTEPQAGSSLADVATRATPRGDGSYVIRGSKMFISAGDHDLADNIVHMVLARVDGAPAGTKGVSLFCVPKKRIEGGALVDNDVAVAGVIHKIGWKGLPSLALAFGDRGECRGWLVGEANRGLNAMFQMMNEARIMVGMNGVATASVAYFESLDYATGRTQGRPASAKDPAAPQVAIVEHADVRRMLLRQKAIVEGGLCLIGRTAVYADRAANDPRAQLLLDLLTPVAKTFPAERGFESNALALQIHGGYGYTSEYLVEALLRDQKLNSLHEGTTGIQGLDLLGRKVMAGGGAAMRALAEEIGTDIAAASDPNLATAVSKTLGVVADLAMALGARGMTGDVDGMLLHSTDFLDIFGTLVIAWQHLAMATAASKLADDELRRGKLLAAEYWIATELPRIDALATVCKRGEDSYARVRAGEL